MAETTSTSTVPPDYAAAAEHGAAFVAALRALAPSREISVAVTNAETALLWLNKGATDAA